MKHFVVYTALFGDYDTLPDIPSEYLNYCDFICFTNNRSINVNNWTILFVDSDLSPILLNRMYKILPHVFLPNYFSSLYIDSNIILKGNPIKLYDRYLTKYDLLFPRHFARNCAYDEYFECVRLGKINIYKGLKQMIFYKRKGLPRNFGLSENNIILRNHYKPNIKSIMEFWWDQFLKFPYRDQLSLPYVIYSFNYKYYFIDETSRLENDFFVYSFHKNENNITIFTKIMNKIFSLFTSIFIIPFCKIILKFS